MAKVTARPSFFCDLETIADHARVCDREEIKASSGKTVMESITYGLTHSTQCWTILLGDQPVSICGVIKSVTYDDCGIVWMISTDKADRRPVAFYRAAQKCLEEMNAQFNCIANFVDARNVDAMRFLESLGFTLEGPVPSGIMGMPFHKFWKIRRYV